MFEKGWPFATSLRKKNTTWIALRNVRCCFFLEKLQIITGESAGSVSEKMSHKHTVE